VRLIVRPDFDGLVCALYLKKIFRISAVAYSEPKDIQDGVFQVQPGDIIANLPYHPNCSWWFDHHASNEIPESFRGLFEIAPSAAGLIWKAYKDQFPKLQPFEYLTEQTDIIDGALLSKEDILNPQGYILLSMTVVPSHDLTDADYWDYLIDCLEVNDPHQILSDPIPAARVAKFLSGKKEFEDVLLRSSKMKGKVVLTDFLSVSSDDLSQNRFVVYALFPEAEVSITLTRMKDKPGLVKLNVAKSVLNRKSELHIGFILREFGGGGHSGAGSTRIEETRLPEILALLIDRFNQD